jgi:hypothetical protein
MFLTSFHSKTSSKLGMIKIIRSQQVYDSLVLLSYFWLGIKFFCIVKFIVAFGINIGLSLSFKTPNKMVVCIRLVKHICFVPLFQQHFVIFFFEL